MVGMSTNHTGMRGAGDRMFEGMRDRQHRQRRDGHPENQAMQSASVQIVRAPMNLGQSSRKRLFDGSAYFVLL